jgi:hypothetical protein
MKDSKSAGQTPVHLVKKKALEGIAQCLLEAHFGQGEFTLCRMDNCPWTFCSKSMMSSSFNG